MFKEIDPNSIVFQKVENEYCYIVIFIAPLGWPKGYLAKWKLGKHKKVHIKFFDTNPIDRFYSLEIFK